ncbi:DUF4085 family protein [Evansella sp. AB-P1]|uniref:DUF4085 family protein n=1 Tax=Evansella sp. AB-P1 TaxID=3037653 RepID=UPI00241F66B1|nr:DUF4085 family protein [Evansella sp. AB-P1]MDG5786154.1 DUF4085 family protein [Evansella sp. AB-P1]
MWNISKNVKEKFTTCNLLPIHESDRDWEVALREANEEGEDLTARLKEELEEVKEKILHILPTRFIPYVENGTLNQPTLPKAVREDYLQWMKEADNEFEKILDNAYDQTMNAVSFLPSTVQDVFEENLHDSTIKRIQREGDVLHLYINTDGGFSSISLVHFTFQQIIAEESDNPIQVGQWLIYDELMKTEDGYAFRVLFDCPDTEWTITMKKLDANYYYRPTTFTRLLDIEMIDNTTLLEYFGQLNPNFRYFLITPDVTTLVKTFSDKSITIDKGSIKIEKNEMIVTVKDKQFIYNLAEYNPIDFIYTDVYEDPYGHLHDQIPIEKMEEAALSSDLELQVNALNTMYLNPQKSAHIINRVLKEVNITEENEQVIIHFVNHFYNKGILTEGVVEKYKTLLD